jgi:[acyl-carrier-protein] S-malonyltransferase
MTGYDGRSAVLFPGLAPAGYAAIGDFLAHSPAGRRRVARADRILGFSLLDAFRVDGTRNWAVADCAYLACTVALADHLRDVPGGSPTPPGVIEEAAPHPDPAHGTGPLSTGPLSTGPAVCVGLSFGGFAAAVHAGGIDFDDAVRLVVRSADEQARFLAALPEPAGCHFCYRIGRDAVAEIVADLRRAGRWIEISADLGLDVYGVSATLSTLELFKRAVSARGGASIYTMDRPQHCAALTGLRDRLAATVYPEAGFRAPRVPVISDVDGGTATTAEALSRALLLGWTAPVHTRVTVDALTAYGVRRVYLVGPRTMFTRLLGDLFDVVVVGPETVLAEAGAQR